MNYAERIRAFELRKSQAIDRQKAIETLASSEGRSYDDEEKKEFDALDREMTEIDEQITRTKKLEVRDAATATPVTKTNGGNGIVNVNRGPTIISHGSVDRDEDFKGQNFTRRAIARALAYIDPDRRSPWEIAEQRWGKSMPTLVQVIKAGVSEGSSDTWGSELVTADNRYTGDFVELLYASTVYDQLGLFQVPAHVTIKGQDGGATANWVGESKSIPVSAQDYSTVSLTPLKVAAISVCSKELVRDSSPAAEQFIRDSLVQASSQKIDTTFVGKVAGSAGVYPAGIRYGVNSLGSNGSDGDAVRADIAELYAPFIAANYNTSGLVLVMHPARAKAVSLMANSLGQTEFPGITASGGTLLGDRVVTGHNMGSAVVMLIDPRNVWRIGDRGVEISVSDQATLEQDSSPQGAADTPTAASATLMSMFGTESLAFKVVRSINFQKRRTSAVSYMDDSYWGTAGSTTT